VTGRDAAAVGRPAPPDLAALDDDQRARRDRIVAGAVELMLRLDHESVQMKDVAATAHVALGTMYRYFSSKEHLFAEALLAWSDRFRKDVPSPTDARSVDRLKTGYRRAARAFERNPTVYGHLLAVQASTDPWAAELFARFAARQNEAFASFLPRVASPRREQIVAVMDAVLDEGLREWTRGRRRIDDVYESIDSAAELLAG
jgi:AcrR family transcriptional regulator